MSTPREARVELLGTSRQVLLQLLGDLVDRPYRVDQIHRALHTRRVKHFDEITELSKELRAELNARFSVGRPELVDRVQSSDGTVKYLLRLVDGATIEAVDIPERFRRTLCVSSQAGCALACTFCVTGYWGAGRNLSAGEIVGQVHHALEDHATRPVAGEQPTHAEDSAPGLNLVFMGMGEPLLNLKEVRGALEILTENISWRRITLSTAGVLPGIEAMATWPKRPNLAISLHAPDDERRSEIMPINRKYPLREMMPLLARYPLERGRRITFEYTLIAGFNDDPSDAVLLRELLAGLRSKVNLIPLNPDPVLGDLAPPPWARVIAFREALERQGVSATVRRPRGEDVAAACGQLRAFGRPPRAG